MERAVEEGFEEGPIRHCPCRAQVLLAFHFSCIRCGAYFLVPEAEGDWKMRPESILAVERALEAARA
eukprot:6247872-Lingulodinium_polyedra.AAC.1